MPDDTIRLLTLLQISDSFFPSATFAHSFGLDQLVSQGRVRTAGEIERLAGSVLVLSVGTSDAVVAAEATRRAADGDIEGVVALDHDLHAMKAPSELRRAATQTGGRLLEEVAAHVSTPALASFLSELRAGRTPGTYPAALGVIAADFGVEPETAAAVLLFGALNALLQAGMRLLPVSHRDMQGALHRLRPLIACLARQAAEPRWQVGVESFHPVQEIAAMRHRLAETRLFAS